jgi:glycosyltransferase involved in cell wall biosynthesis
MHTIVRITTVPISLKVLLKGQLNFMQQNGFEVIAVSAKGAEVDELKFQENCEHIVVPLTRNINPIADLICLVKLFFLLRRIKPSIVHTHTPKAGLVGMLAAYLARVPIRLHTIAGLPWIIETGIKKRILKSVEKITVFTSSKVFVNSQNLLLYIKNENIKNSKISLLGSGTSNGIDTNYFSNTSEIKQIANQLKIENDVTTNSFIWLFVGRVVRDKGIQELIEAFVNMQNKYPNDLLWILGDEEPELDPVDEQYANILHSNKSIKSFGFQNDVRPFYSAANVLVFPSYREGFPNVPMQAALMDCGLILSNINGCNEIVSNQISGLLVEPNSHKDLMEKMFFARNNQETMNNFSIKAKENIIEKYKQESVWNNLLEEYNKLIYQNGL